LSQRLQTLKVAPSSVQDDLCAEQILEQLDRITKSPQFRSGRHCQNLLRHITERVLAGDSTHLKERSLGVDVFGRPPNYDTNQDPVVRVTAAEVRKKLAQYYVELDHRAQVRIELPSGSYVPVFHCGEPAVLAPPVVPEQPASSPAIPAPPPKWVLPVAVAICCVIAVVVGAVIAFRPHLTSVIEFWQPLLDAPNPVLICLGQPRAFNFASGTQQEMEAKFEKPGGRESTPSTAPLLSVPMTNLIPMWDRYVTLGDAMCLARLSALLEKNGKPFRVRGESATSFSDLRESPTILIGGFNNEWTLRSTGQLRYYFDGDPAQDILRIRDRQQPQATGWELSHAWPQWKIAADYAIVSRVLDRNTDRVVVIVAGITHFGTIAAGEFLTSPEYFSEVVPKLPNDWKQHNIQIVLRTPVVQGISGHPQVLATHVW
jgi:hypothetical protein